MDIILFKNQPYHPNISTQGEITPPRTQQDLIDFKFLALELGPLFHTTPANHYEPEPTQLYSIG